MGGILGIRPGPPSWYASTPGCIVSPEPEVWLLKKTWPQVDLLCEWDAPGWICTLEKSRWLQKTAYTTIFLRRGEQLVKVGSAVRQQTQGSCVTATHEKLSHGCTWK